MVKADDVLENIKFGVLLLGISLAAQPLLGCQLGPSGEELAGPTVPGVRIQFGATTFQRFTGPQPLT